MMIKTSLTHPIYASWILEGLPGRVGLTIAPGKTSTAKYSSARWERDLATDLDALRAGGLDMLVCLLEDQDLARLGIPHLFHEARARGITVRRLPIRDMAVPDIADVKPLVADILAAARAGESVVIHCEGGLGRAGTIGGCVLVANGMTPDDALTRLRERRGVNCPESPEQKQHIRRFAER